MISLKKDGQFGFFIWFLNRKYEQKFEHLIELTCLFNKIFWNEKEDAFISRHSET